MALQECGLNLNRVSKELQPHGSLEFPCAGYASHHTERPEDVIPWHWHEEMELIYIERGRMEIRIPSKIFLLNEGDCIVLNAGTLHYAQAAPVCDLRSLVFSPALITGSDDLVFSKKYMQPLLSCSLFTGYYISEDVDGDIARWFNYAFEALARDQSGFEFVVRDNLSRICLFLYKKFEAEISAGTLPTDQDDIRIRTMFAYIHRHFADDISLTDISQVAGISERECLRCFQKTIRISPIQYLLRYRIMQGAEMLLQCRTKSISEIAASCGFDSQSYFAELFKRFYKCSPREYRK